ncbi:hypothetical protein ISS07_03090 [Candidatus Woesearchaeota archaeon]|nr:hypothetical protein [Candidatus Woesearchaeota archaeon]
MKESLENAITELKRVDHLYYVSLKYTRTVDMMKHMVERLISTFSFAIEAILEQAKDDGLIEEIPANLGLRAKLVMDTFKDEELLDCMNFYIKLRKILRAKYTKREEFRRHVTMTATIDNGEVIEVNIDLLKEYYDKAKEFIRHIRISVFGEEELDV